MLELLPALAGQVYVPEAVVAELEEGRRRNVTLPVLEDLSWLIVRPVRDRAAFPLVAHPGGGALGLETQDALLLLDDRDARRYARTLELEITGTLGLLLRAKERGILYAVQPVLDRLQALRFRLNVRMREMVLKRAGETT